ncbi:MAG: hypothetical protein AAF789_04720 [Bacteroidota bacterium]
MEKQTNTWPELAIGLYDKLTGRNAKIHYSFEEMSIEVPAGTGSTESATWKLNGSLTISTTEG